MDKSILCYEKSPDANLTDVKHMNQKILEQFIRNDATPEQGGNLQYFGMLNGYFYVHPSFQDRDCHDYDARLRYSPQTPVLCC